MASQSLIRSNSRMVGYVTMFVVGVLVLLFSWRIYEHTQLQLDHVWVRFHGASDLIGSLQPDDPVAIHGVRIGQVEEIVSAKDGVRVGLRFWTPQRLFRDAHAANGGNGLMGMRFVLLDPGVDSSRELDRGQEIPGQFQPGVAEVMSKIEDVVETVKTLKKRVAVLAHGDSITPSFARKLDGELNRIDSILGGFEKLEKTAEGMGPRIRAMGATASGMGRTLDSLRPELIATLQSTDTVLEQARVMLGSMRDVAHRTDSLIVGVSTSVDPLVKNDSLLQKIEASLKVVDQIQSFLDGGGNVKFNFHVLGSNPSKKGE